jgi:peptide/nickel transport system ATP-binding protein
MPNTRWPISVSILCSMKSGLRPSRKQAAKRSTKPIALSVLPNSSAPASELITPPSNAPTTARPSTVPKSTATGEAVISAKDVTRVFRSRCVLFAPVREVTAVAGVSLSLMRGETLALVGESGSGKSTLARILLGLDRPTSGSVAMRGRPVAQLSPRERAGFVQPVFQDPYASLNPRRTLAEIVGRPLALRGEGTRAERLARVREAMETVRLPMRLLRTYPAQLSGGQRQRVAIARALITRPAVLVCDEPTSALDVSVQAQILDLLSRLRAELGVTTLIITHNMAVVNQIADRVAVMFQGRLVEVGPVADVLRSPAQDYTRTLLAAAPRFLQASRFPSAARSARCMPTADGGATSIGRWPPISDCANSWSPGARSTTCSSSTSCSFRCLP